MGPTLAEGATVLGVARGARARGQCGGHLARFAVTMKVMVRIQIRVRGRARVRVRARARA